MAETGNWSDYIVGRKGRILRQECFAENKRPIFVKAVIGTGVPDESVDLDNINSLVSYAKDVVHKKSYTIEENHISIVRVDNAGYTNQVDMAEVGVYAKKDGQDDNEAILYGYAYNMSGVVEIPAQTSITNRKIFEIALDTGLSRSIEIVIVFDGSTLFVSHDDLDEALENHIDHPEQHPYLNPKMPNVGNIVEAISFLDEVTVKTKSPLTFDTESRVNIYVNNSSGKDTNSGLSEVEPLKTLDQGIRLTRTYVSMFDRVRLNLITTGTNYQLSENINSLGSLEIFSPSLIRPIIEVQKAIRVNGKIGLRYVDFVFMNTGGEYINAGFIVDNDLLLSYVTINMPSNSSATAVFLNSGNVNILTCNINCPTATGSAIYGINAGNCAMNDCKISGFAVGVRVENRNAHYYGGANSAATKWQESNGEIYRNI